jgi:hypothetical protein
MKTTPKFKEVIKHHLDILASHEPAFGLKYANEQKSVEDCCTYILNTVKKSGINGYADEEIYAMAIHYYDEEDINVGSPVNANVVINQKIELTDEEKADARKKAIDSLVQEEKNKLIKKSTTSKPVNVQSSLF